MDINKRLNLVIQKGKQFNPKNLIEVIKSDLYYLLNNYFEIDFSDIDVEISLEKDKYSININCFGDRLKAVQVLP